MAGRVLRPLHQVTETARRIAARRRPTAACTSGSRWTARTTRSRSWPTPSTRCWTGSTTSFDGQRRFVANASHELRTPLTINRTLLEVAMHRRTASAGRASSSARRCWQINARHERLIDGLLLLARVRARGRRPVAGRPGRRGRRTSSRRPRPEAAAAGVTVHEAAAPAPTARRPGAAGAAGAEPGRERHPAQRRRRTAGCASPAAPPRTARSRLVVSQHRPGRAAVRVPTLFEPFRRLGADRLATGTRRGARPVHRPRRSRAAHGGDVVARPRDGGGLVVTAHLPHATPWTRSDP